jgi:hypothetical protein
MPSGRKTKRARMNIEYFFIAALLSNGGNRKIKAFLQVMAA